MRKVARVRELVTDATGLSERISGVFDQFINPDLEAASLLLRLFEVPGAAEVMEFGDGKVWVIGLLMDSDGPLVGTKLKELPPDEGLSGTLIGAISRGNHVIIPSGDDTLKLGDEVYIATGAGYVKVFWHK